MTVLLDGTVLSNVAAIGRLDLLAQALEYAYIVTAVREEVARGIQLGHDFLAKLERQIAPTNPDGWLRVTAIEADEEQAHLRSMPPKLGDGEAM